MDSVLSIVPTKGSRPLPAAPIHAFGISATHSPTQHCTSLACNFMTPNPAEAKYGSPEDTQHHASAPPQADARRLPGTAGRIEPVQALLIPQASPGACWAQEQQPHPRCTGCLDGSKRPQTSCQPCSDPSLPRARPGVLAGVEAGVCSQGRSSAGRGRRRGAGSPLARCAPPATPRAATAARRSCRQQGRARQGRDRSPAGGKATGRVSLMSRGSQVFPVVHSRIVCLQGSGTDASHTTWRAARARQPSHPHRRARHCKRRGRLSQADSFAHTRLLHTPDERCPGTYYGPDLAGDAGAAAAACSPGAPPATATPPPAGGAAGGAAAGASVGGACGAAAAAAR